MNTFLKNSSAFMSILMLVILNSCDNIEKQFDHRNVSITPLVNPVMVGESFTFQAFGDISKKQRIYWDLGDGTFVTGVSVVHTYTKPGIYQIVLHSDKNGIKVKQSSAIVRVHTPETVELPQVFLDTDARCEADDQHYIAYCLYSGLDVLGINSIHNNEPNSEAINYGEIFNIMKLMNYSGVSWDSMPADRVFHGATEKLTQPTSGLWSDTNPIITEGSEAILAAARGAWPGNPAIIIPVFQWGSTTILKSIHDVCVPATVISEYLGLGWVLKTETIRVSGPENDYTWQHVDGPSSVRLIWDIDGKAMKTDLFNTLNGHSTRLLKDTR